MTDAYRERAAAAYCKLQAVRRRQRRQAGAAAAEAPADSGL
jgi:hypothetical protein